MGGCQGKILPPNATSLSKSINDSQSTIVEDGQHHHEKKPGTADDLPVAFGRTLREKYFSLDPDYHNLNHSKTHTSMYHNLNQ